MSHWVIFQKFPFKDICQPELPGNFYENDPNNISFNNKEEKS